MTYPVEDLSPALESDALEDSQHGLPDVVEVCDAVLRPLPVVVTDGAVGTLVEAPARCWLLRHLPCTTYCTGDIGGRGL